MLSQDVMLYTLHLFSAVCSLYINKGGGGKKDKIMCNIMFNYALTL